MAASVGRIRANAQNSPKTAHARELSEGSGEFKEKRGALALWEGGCALALAAGAGGRRQAARGKWRVGARGALFGGVGGRSQGTARFREAWSARERNWTCINGALTECSANSTELGTVRSSVWLWRAKSREKARRCVAQPVTYRACAAVRSAVAASDWSFRRSPLRLVPPSRGNDVAPPGALSFFFGCTSFSPLLWALCFYYLIAAPAASLFLACHHSSSSCSCSRFLFFPRFSFRAYLFI